MAETTITGSDVVLAHLMRPTAELCLRVLTALRDGQTPSPQSTQMALDACNFLLGLPFRAPNLACREDEREAEEASKRERLKCPSDALTGVAPEVIFLIFRHIGAVHSQKLEIRRAGQRHLVEAGLANRHFHSISTTILWRNPYFRSFPDVLRFALGLQLNAGRGGQSAGDVVKRLVLPAIPAWSIGGPQLLSSLIAGIAAGCSRGLRTLKLDARGNAIGIKGLAAVFATCQHLTALRITLELTRREVESSQEDDNLSESSSGSAAGTVETEDNLADDTTNERLDVNKVVVAGIARLTIFELAGLISFTHEATSCFLTMVRAGIGASLQVFCLKAFEDPEISQTRAGDLAALVSAVAARCPHLEVLQMLLPDEQPEGLDELTDALEKLPATCSQIHTLAIRHRPRPNGASTQPYTMSDYPISYVSALRPALRQLVIGLRSLVRLDMQGAEADEEVVHALAVRAPLSLNTLLIDIDACPPPKLLHLIERRGAQLRRLSLLSVVHHPAAQLLAAIAANCTELVNLGLWLQAPDPTESLRQLEFMFPDKWNAALKDILRGCTKLTRVELCWLPPAVYSDAGIELDAAFPGLIDWGTFPTTARSLPSAGYPEW
ncbi:hypothetical protein HDU86_005810 [Geranomyces michiganensis]|nr:hypothetical protein HDU86_005810 [Geranomyces michiganensis]